MVLKYGMSYKLLFEKHSVPVALAGQTGGAIRVVLDFFVSPERSRRMHQVENIPNLLRGQKEKKNIISLFQTHLLTCSVYPRLFSASLHQQQCGT